MPKISEDQRQARRDQILTASWRCCTRRGIQATRMEEIVREANLSAGTPLCRSRTTQRRRYRPSTGSAQCHAECRRLCGVCSRRGIDFYKAGEIGAIFRHFCCAVRWIASERIIENRAADTARPSPGHVLPDFRDCITSLLLRRRRRHSGTAVPTAAWIRAEYLDDQTIHDSLASHRGNCRAAAGWLVNRIPTAWLCAAGGSLLAAGLSAIALTPLKGHSVQLVLLTILSGLGFGLFQVPDNRNMFLSAPRERSAAAGGMQGTARLTGQTTGALIMTMLFTSTGINAAPRLGLIIAAVLTLASGLVSTFRVTRIATDGVGAPTQVTIEP